MCPNSDYKKTRNIQAGIKSCKLELDYFFSYFIRKKGIRGRNQWLLIYVKFKPYFNNFTQYNSRKQEKRSLSFAPPLTSFVKDVKGYLVIEFDRSPQLGLRLTIPLTWRSLIQAVSVLDKMKKTASLRHKPHLC